MQLPIPCLSPALSAILLKNELPVHLVFIPYCVSLCDMIFSMLCFLGRAEKTNLCRLTIPSTLYPHRNGFQDFLSNILLLLLKHSAKAFHLFVGFPYDVLKKISFGS